MRRFIPAVLGLLLLGIGFAGGHYVGGKDRRLLEECQDTLAHYVAESLAD